MLNFFSLKNAKKTQTTNMSQVFYSARKEFANKHSKVAAAKKTFFSSVHVIGTNCFNECFLCDVKTGRHFFS